MLLMVVTPMPVMNNSIGLSSLCLLILLSCEQGEKIPQITTAEVTRIGRTSAISGGNISGDNGQTVTQRGVCWSIDADPELTDDKTNDGIGGGSFESSITDLAPNTTYFVRAYATNSVGTAYGEEFKFTTYKTDAAIDIDGNFYNTLTIGTQVWMTENLKTTRYNNSDLIGTTTPFNKDISSELAPKYQWAYNDHESNVAVYGRLYTWYAITDSRKVCPPGWHVPSDYEMTTLATYLGGKTIAGGKLKEAGTRNWVSPNTGATNETGFTALPVGIRHSLGIFEYFGHLGYLWCSTEYSLENGSNRFMKYDETYFWDSAAQKDDGLSVRCLKD